MANDPTPISHIRLSDNLDHPIDAVTVGGKETEEIETLMADETWWTGDAAVENGFCDELMFENSQTVVENSKRLIVNEVPIDVSGFKTLPTTILDSPHNTGSLDNSEKKKEEKNMAENNTTTKPAPSTTVEALETAYPDLVASIKNNAAAEERKRIKDIKDMALDGFENIVEDAMFDNPVTAEQAAVKIINEQKKQGTQYLADRDADVTDAQTNKVGADSSEKGRKDVVDEYNKAIDELFPDKK